MATDQVIAKLEELTHEMRTKLITFCGSFGGAVHIGGDLSMAEVLIVLYNHALNVNPAEIMMPERDRFIMSKGHGAFAMYLTMAMRGFFDYDEIVATYGKLDSAYGMHPCKVQLPGVECSSGSLGQGLSMAVGMALNGRRNKKDYRVYCMIGDGESCEGQVWEAANTANSYGLGNLVAVIDRNKQLMSSRSEDTVKLEPYCDKWRAFGFNVVEVDGHDVSALVDVFDNLPNPLTADKPTAIVCNTIKGKGVSFMEGNIGWHAGALGEDDMNTALADLDAAWAAKKGGR